MACASLLPEPQQWFWAGAPSRCSDNARTKARFHVSRPVLCVCESLTLSVTISIALVLKQVKAVMALSLSSEFSQHCVLLSASLRSPLLQLCAGLRCWYHEALNPFLVEASAVFRNDLPTAAAFALEPISLTNQNLFHRHLCVHLCQKFPYVNTVINDHSCVSAYSSNKTKHKQNACVRALTALVHEVLLTEANRFQQQRRHLHHRTSL